MSVLNVIIFYLRSPTKNILEHPVHPTHTLYARIQTDVRGKNDQK